MKYLITGGCGFLGSNIASQLLKNGEELVIFDNLSRFGSYQNFNWLGSQGQFEFIHGDIRNTNDVDSLIRNNKPDVIYHLAGQVAMTTSIANPRLDFEVNVGGSFNLLNAVRRFSPGSTIIYSSTNKVYGDLEQFQYHESETRYVCVDKPNGFDEKVNLDFHSPYGTSKGSADQYMLDFSRIYNLNTVVFRHSSMYGGRQFSTFDQGWVGWFTQQAVRIKSGINEEPFSISGNGKQVRDLLHADDCVRLYIQAGNYSDTIRGQVFNIGGGMKNSMSLRELFTMLEQKLDINMYYDQNDPRQSDQRVFVADISKIVNALRWEPVVNNDSGLDKMIEWVKESYENR